MRDWRGSTVEERPSKDSDVKLLRELLTFLHNRPTVKEPFAKMLHDLQSGERSMLSERQRTWAREELEKWRPSYENLVSSGKVPKKTTVETIAALRRENLPLKPPGRR